MNFVTQALALAILLSIIPSKNLPIMVCSAARAFAVDELPNDEEEYFLEAGWIAGFLIFVALLRITYNIMYPQQ